MRTLDIHEAAAKIKVHTNTVLDLAGRGVLPGAKIGRAWVFDESDVDAFIKRQIKEQSESRLLPKFERKATRSKVCVPLQHTRVTVPGNQSDFQVG